MDFLKHNKRVWEHYSKIGGEWASIVPQSDIEAAKIGKYQFSMSPDAKPLPQNWLGDCRNLELLCVGGGGGQQGPLLSAMGANVTVFDFSSNQLKLDEMAKERYGLNLKTVQGDMRDLSCFKDESFDLIVNPASNMFIDDLSKLWIECYRVLRHKGKLLSSSMNPMAFAFGRDELDVNANPVLKYAVPYSDLKDLTKEELDQKNENHFPLEFGHSLSQIIGDQLRAGFVLADFLEGYWGQKYEYKGDKMFPQYLITLAQKVSLSRWA